MTVHELISKSAHEVRNNETLMRLYIAEYKDAFGKEPNCAPCTFTNDWKKLVNRVRFRNVNSNLNKSIIMETEILFVIKPKFRNNILTYREDNRPYRVYGSKATNSFVRKFLTVGTEAELEARRKLFDSVSDELFKDDEGNHVAQPSSAVTSEENSVSNSVQDSEDDSISPELAELYRSTFNKKVYYQWGRKKVEDMIAKAQAEQ